MLLIRGLGSHEKIYTKKRSISSFSKKLGSSLPCGGRILPCRITQSNGRDTFFLSYWRQNWHHGVKKCQKLNGYSMHTDSDLRQISSSINLLGHTFDFLLVWKNQISSAAITSACAACGRAIATRTTIETKIPNVDFKKD